MTAYERFERVLNDLDRLGSKARKASLLQSNLESKLQAQSVVKALEDARRIMRLKLFDAEDTFAILSDSEVSL